MRTTLEMMRVWAAATGLLLVALVFIQMYLGRPVAEALPMLVAAIAGFELVLFAQDLIQRRRGRNG